MPCCYGNTQYAESVARFRKMVICEISFRGNAETETEREREREREGEREKYGDLA